MWIQFSDILAQKIIPIPQNVFSIESSHLKIAIKALKQS
jgi:hypothetical protein